MIVMIRITYICDGCRKKLEPRDVFAIHSDHTGWVLPTQPSLMLDKAERHVCSRECGQKVARELDSTLPGGPCSKT